jgi:hypothetical protein
LEESLPRIVLRMESDPVAGENIYQAIPEMIEFRRLRSLAGRTRSLGLGRVMLSLDAESGDLLGLTCYVKTGRWRSLHSSPPPEVDAEGILAVDLLQTREDMVFVPAEPDFIWHEESRSLRISFNDALALVFRVADCLLVGVDREGHFTDIWLLDLDLALP